MDLRCLRDRFRLFKFTVNECNSFNVLYAMESYHFNFICFFLDFMTFFSSEKNYY